MTVLSKSSKISEDERVKLAKHLFREYLKILSTLSEERRKIFQKTLKKLEQDKITEVRSRLQKIN